MMTLGPYLEKISKAYMDVYDEAIRVLREYYGLRDFYNFIKMIFLFVRDSKQRSKTLTWPQIEYAVLRNFGGLDLVDPVSFFRKRLQNTDLNMDITDVKQFLSFCLLYYVKKYSLFRRMKCLTPHQQRLFKTVFWRKRLKCTVC